MTTSQGFSSELGPTIAAYLTLKKALGRRFRVETDVLSHLDKFLVGQPSQEGPISATTFTAWSLTLAHLAPTVRRNRMRIVRNLCLYLRRSDPSCFVPDPRCFPAHAAASPHLHHGTDHPCAARGCLAATPVRYTAVSAGVPARHCTALYGRAAPREVVRLVLGDYDPLEHTILIRASKFHKSRLVAVSGDAIRELELYLQARRRLPHGSSSPLLVHRCGGLRAYSGPSFGRSLHRLFMRADIRTVDGRIPRVHDLRHTYAVHALLRWYRSGLDVQAKLPILATAMGHVSIASTAYYLRFIEPITQVANERFAQYWQSTIPATPPGGGRS